MNAALMTGTRVVVLALISYSVGIIVEQKKHKVSNTVIIFLSLGIVLDIVATAFMIIGSSNSPFTLHGFLGYSALGAMLLDTIFVWRYRLKNGLSDVSKSLHLYSRYAYLWWVIAFITGGLLVVIK